MCVCVRVCVCVCVCVCVRVCIYILSSKPILYALVFERNTQGLFF